MKTQRPQPLKGTPSLLTSPSIIKKHQTKLWLLDPWKMISQGQRLIPLRTQPVDTGHWFHRCLSTCGTGRGAAGWDICSECCPFCPLRAASSSWCHGFSWSPSAPQILRLSPQLWPDLLPGSVCRRPHWHWPPLGCTIIHSSGSMSKRGHPVTCSSQRTYVPGLPHQERDPIMVTVKMMLPLEQQTKAVLKFLFVLMGLLLRTVTLGRKESKRC